MFGHQYVARIVADFAFNQRKQAGFAGAVFANQPHACAGVDGERGFVEQHFAAALQGEVFQFDHGLWVGKGLFRLPESILGLHNVA